MSDYLVSIIIPIYKVEKYLTRCIESVINQTYSNIEIIMVDDGSPDKCPIICDKYKLKDPRITVIHQSNSGLSSARIVGINKAKGEFIYFVDGDDYLPKNAIELLVCQQRKENFDLVFGNFIIEKKLEKKEIERDYSESKDDFLKKIVSNIGVHHFVWGVLIRRNLYVKYAISPQPGINVGEDLQVLPQLIYYAEKYNKIDKYIYYYNQTNVNSLTAKYSLTRLEQDIRSIIIVEEFFKKLSETIFYNLMLRSELKFILANIFTLSLQKNTLDPCRQLIKYANSKKFRRVKKDLPLNGRIMLSLKTTIMMRVWGKIRNCALFLNPMFK